MYCTECRICNNKGLDDVIELGKQAITSVFPTVGDYSTPEIDVTLCLCDSCGLLQLRQTTNPKDLYQNKYDYGYVSGISNTMRKHLLDYKEEIETIIKLEPSDVIIDIGSNDSTMLNYYSSDYRRIGVDPTGKQFEDKYKSSNIELIPTFFTYKNVIDKVSYIKCKLISSISMFYDLPDPVQFAKDIHLLLDTDGIWTCEQSYVLSMLKTNSLDTICHEHLEYYSLHQIVLIAKLSGFVIIDVKFNDCNGGSFRVYFAKQESKKYKEKNLSKILEDEKQYKLSEKSTYTQFMKQCDIEIENLKRFINIVNENGQQVYIYGASTKGNCLLQYAGITQKHIKYAVERNLDKVGKMTSTGIEIISEETMRQNPPDYLLVLPWHFKEEILKRETEYLSNGGQFIFPLPTFQIIGSKQKVLLTGCDGMLSKYFKSLFPSKYYLYGIGHNDKCYENNMTKVYFDMNDKHKLKEVLLLLNPDIIIHFAAISSSDMSTTNTIDVLNTNGMVCAYLCDIIHINKMNTKLFNASSSDIYKGHSQYIVTDDDTFRTHLHPYSIAKIMSTSTIEYYRNTYDLPFSNGIIFTSESKYKSEKFLLKKLSNHIKTWKQNQIPLQIGNLDSFRNIVHASDVVNAVQLIVEKDLGDTYVICSDKIQKVEDIVLQLYQKAGISLTKTENVYYDNTHREVLVVENKNSIDTNIVCIDGVCEKLKKLNWSPRVSIEDILNEYLE